mgnify:CR=1 FL=1
MIRKSFLLVILCFFVFFASGCASQGCQDDVGFIKKADNWVKKNLW